MNDRYGHQAGDEFLVAAAERLQSATPRGDLVARVGGDEFAVLVHHYDPDSAHPVHVGEAICEAFSTPIRVEGLEHRLAASVGIVAIDAMAQEARLIVPLGRRVVHEVCRHLTAWRDGGLPLDTLSVHFNVSPMEAAHAGTYASIADAMDMWNIPSQTLVIEMTETASIDSIDTAGRFLANLHEMGVRVCLDDFGTGFSSLRHLNDFQVDAIKIDRSFVVSATKDPAKIPIVAGIIALARGLNAEVIAEGIETLEQRKLIEDLGCRLVQGYLFGRPTSADDAFRFAQRTLATIART